jgi:acetyl esterase
MTLHPQALAALELWTEGPSVGTLGFGEHQVAAMREEARRAAAAEPKEPVDEAHDVDAEGVRCRVYLPSPAGRHATLVFLHGGGFVFGDLDTHDAQARRLANRTGLGVLAVDYRRPPEHRFPAAPDDVDTALRWLSRAGAEHGLDPGRTAVVGDSAGGNLALVAAMRNPGRFLATVLVYPFLDPVTDRPSYTSTTGGLTRDEADWYWRQYAGAPDDLADPDLAPLRSAPGRFADLREPLLVQVAEHDVLVDEDVELVRLLEKSGADVHLSTYPGMIHGFWRHPELFDAAEDALAELAAFLHRHV